MVWDEIAGLIGDLVIRELIPLMRQPYEDGLVNEYTTGWSEIENVAFKTGYDPLEGFQLRHPPITDVAKETAWWAMYAREAVKDDDISDAPNFAD